MAHLYNPQLDAFEIYHREQEGTGQNISGLIGPALPALGHALSGSTGTAISHLIIYPLDLVITRLQVQRQLQNRSAKGTNEGTDEYKGILDAAQRIYAEEGGLQAFYSGVAHDTAKSVVDSFLFFLAYNFLRKSRQHARGGSGTTALPVVEELGVGMLAGAFSKFWTTPVQNIVTRKQTAAMLAAKSAGGASSSVTFSTPTTSDIATQIRDEKGLQGFWSGYSASLILTLNPALTFLLHEAFLRTLLPNSRRADPGARLTFAVAAASKAIASTITYPFSLAKSRAQVSSEPPSHPVSSSEKDTQDQSYGDATRTNVKSAASKAATKARYQKTVFATILQIARTEGIAGLYQGLSGEVFKGFFAHGLTMLVKEWVHSAVIQLYYLGLKLLQKYPTSHLKEQIGQSGEKTSQAAGHFVQQARSAGEGVVQQTRDLANSATEQIKTAASSAASQTGAAFTKAQEATQNGVREVQNSFASVTTPAGVVPAAKNQGAHEIRRAADADAARLGNVSHLERPEEKKLMMGDVYGKGGGKTQ